MAILKSPEPLPKNVTLQIRVSQKIKSCLIRYAEFIHSTPSYVASQVLERLFKKDLEFQRYLANYKANEVEDRIVEQSQSPTSSSNSGVAKE